jgi:Raf kinase inhibitor-like YbhB/YbcL family protein
VGNPILKRYTVILLIVASLSFIIAGCGTKAKEPVAAKVQEPFVLTSAAFKNGGRMDPKFAHSNENISVPLEWSGVPEGTKTLALLVVDLHPTADEWEHWLVVNMPADAVSIPEGASGKDRMPAGSKELLNFFGTTGYGGPQPPLGSGDHEYKFTLYALDVDSIEFPELTAPKIFLQLTEGHVLGTAEISGFFESVL